MWETAYDVTDPTFDCNVNRTKGDTSTQLYTINHFLDKEVNIIANTLTPDKDALNTTNAASGTGSLGLQASECGAQYGRYPNFMLVDVSIMSICLIMELNCFSVLRVWRRIGFRSSGNLERSDVFAIVSNRHAYSGLSERDIKQ